MVVECSVYNLISILKLIEYIGIKYADMSSAKKCEKHFHRKSKVFCFKDYPNKVSRL